MNMAGFLPGRLEIPAKRRCTPRCNRRNELPLFRGTPGRAFFQRTLVEHNKNV